MSSLGPLASDGSSTGGSAPTTTGPSNPTTNPVPPQTTITTATTQPSDSDSRDDSDDDPPISYPDEGTWAPCSTLEQDCPDGEMCTAWSYDGGDVCRARAGAGLRFGRVLHDVLRPERSRAPAPPCLPDQTCVAWYAEGQVPGGDPSSLGVCIVE